VKNNPVRFIDPSGLKCYCGPEIASQLRTVLDQVLNAFDALTDTKKADACDSLTSYPHNNFNNIEGGDVSWDIYDFHGGGDANFMNYLRMNGGCANTKNCARTVMVNGQCHEDWAVNYVLYGTAWRKCQRDYPIVQWLLRNNTPWPTPYLYFAKYVMNDFVWIFTASRTLNDKTYHWPDIPKKLAWADAGYDNWYLGTRTPPAMVSNCAKCPTGMGAYYLSAYWNFDISVP
jgi:hypothetical protein